MLIPPDMGGGTARWCHGRRRRGSWRSEYCGEAASGDGEILHKHDTMRLSVYLVALTMFIKNRSILQD